MTTAVADAERGLEQADAAYARFDTEAVVVHLSAAIRGFTAAGDKCRAALACVRLGDTYANALGNLTASRAWFARAWRLVEGEPACLEQGWVAIAAMGCDVDDPAELLRAAELALGLARRFGDINLETKALADAGLAHVESGRIPQGMALLEEAMALACGPADHTDTAAKSVCSFFTACYYAADFERAASWTDLLRRQGLIGSSQGAPIFLSSHCDSVHATLLIELGRWTEAEEVLTRARSDFEAAMQMPSWHPDIALADLRVRQGRLAEAEALLVGKDQSLQALVPAVQLHLARGDQHLANAAARRGLRVVGGDRPRAVELLAVIVEAELAAGDLAAARAALADLTERAADLGLSTLDVRAAVAEARVLGAGGDPAGAMAVIEASLDRLDPRQLPWRRITLLVELARLREQAGDPTAARIDAEAAATALAALDVVIAPSDAVLLDRLRADRPRTATSDATRIPRNRTATLARDHKWWVVSSGDTTARLPDTKGLRYLAELVATPGVERHALDLVDRVEGIAAERGLDRRSLGDAGALVDSQARRAYRLRIEELRSDVDEALAADRLEKAEALQDELDRLVAQLSSAFGLGGRERKAASAAERARLNVTRALRSAITKLVEAMPGDAEALDRRVRTGLYCVYQPADGDEVRWIVQS